MRYLILLFVSMIVFTGCGSVLPLNYPPSSTMVVKGETKIGDFEYLPVQKFDIKENQIRNTAIGSALFEKNINQFFKDALFNESRLVGINVGSDKNILSGQINDFLMDDLGHSVDWTLVVRYDLKKDGVLCFSKTKVIDKNTLKGAVLIFLNQIIQLNIEELFKDEDFKKCIQ